ncbi:MAG: hypothetical protein FJX94_09420, partial [Bacteroidetes bacterium]|nr:hypothetical protein [Bacteroidota bacterium]
QAFDPYRNIVTIVVPNAPGGPADSAGRIFADYLNKQNINAVVQNKAGAGGAVGAAQVATQAGNPYMLMVGFKTPIIFTPITAANTVTYTENTFQPVGMIGTLNIALVTNPSQVKSTSAVTFFNEYGTNNQKINFGTFAGLFESYVKQLTASKGIIPNIIIYKSSAQLLTDLVGGSVQVGLLDLNSAKPLIDDGKLGHISDFQFPADMQSWWGIYAPPGTGRETVEFYSKMLMAMHADADFQTRLRRAFNNPKAMNLKEFEQFHAAEVAGVKRLIGAK